ncbi:MAG TPA: hypothetical protein VJ959_06835 [Desulfotignum sp.]|nr:hypothetical protein [Desulfotignum sp.]
MGLPAWLPPRVVPCARPEILRAAVREIQKVGTGLLYALLPF